jgi:hypothetical protein
VEWGQARAGALKECDDKAEMERLANVFAVERGRASERIMRITAEHEMVLVQRMQMLGLAA